MRNERATPCGGRLVWSSNWYPQNYSSCGLYAAENAHLAWAYYHYGLTEEGFDILEALRDAHFMGYTPGTVAHCLSGNGFNSGCPDFPDFISIYLRLLVEGLWGIRMNRLDMHVSVTLNLPSTWNHARIRIPDVELDYARNRSRETLKIRNDAPVSRTIRIPMRSSHIESVTLNGQHDTPYVKEADFCIRERCVTESPVCGPETFIPLAINRFFNIALTDIHKQTYLEPRPEGYSIMTRANGRFGWDWNAGGFNQVVVDDSRLRQSNGTWVTDSGIPFCVPATGLNAACVSIWDNFPEQMEFPLSGWAHELAVFMIGVTNPMQARVENARLEVRYVDGTMETVSLVHLRLLQNPS